MTLIKKISAVFLSSVAFTSTSGLVANRFFKSENKGPAYLDWVDGKGLGGGSEISSGSVANGSPMEIF